MPRRTVRLAVVVAVLLSSVAPAARAETVYRQPLIQPQPSASIFDILIVPPYHGRVIDGDGLLGGEPAAEELSPLENSYLDAIEDSIRDYDRAIDAYAASWLADALVFNTYLLGRDVPPPEALRDPEIVIVTDENKGPVLGFALLVGAGFCLIDNSKFFIESMSYEDMFNINVQEFGHCLGLAHVNEASPPNLDDENMRHDALNGEYRDPISAADGHTHCVSNLNVRGLEEVSRYRLTGQPPGPAQVAIGAYERIPACGSRA